MGINNEFNKVTGFLTGAVGVDREVSIQKPVDEKIDTVAKDTINEAQLSKKREYPAIARWSVNTVKTFNAVIWTVARVAVTILLIVPAYIVYKISPLLRGDAAKSSKRVESTRPYEKMEGSRSSSHSVKSKESAVPTEAAKTLEQLKAGARKSPEIRRQYFENYSNNVEEIFGARSVAGSMHKDVNEVEEATWLSRESYLNLNLVYRFDGEHMVGRTICLINGRGEDEKCVEYKVDRYFSEPGGMVGYGLVPTTDTDAPPRLIFRGTRKDAYISDDKKKYKPPSGFIADTASNIGEKTYANRKESISEWLKDKTENGKKKAMVSGHSLGGNIAQRVAIDNTDTVGQVFTLNSPRLEGRLKDEASVHEGMQITHVVMDADIVPSAGGGRIKEGALLTNGKDDNIISVPGGGHTSKKLNNFCMKKKEFAYTSISTETQLARVSFFASVVNFIRPNVDYL